MSETGSIMISDCCFFVVTINLFIMTVKSRSIRLILRVRKQFKKILRQRIKWMAK